MSQTSYGFAGKRILLVEDNRVNSSVTAEILSHLGCHVAVAQHGEEALAMVDAQRYDLILMDCHMPVMDGFEATRHLRKRITEGRLKDLPIVALTGTSQQHDLEMALDSGMNDIMLKPANLENMTATLSNWLFDETGESLSSQQLRARSIKAMSMPAALPAEHYGVDVPRFGAMRTMLGMNFTTILTYYLEDAQNYITQLGCALQADDTESLRDAAYALRSASRQMGFPELAYFADRMELAAQHLLRGETADDPQHLLFSIRKEMERLEPFILEQCRSAQAA